MSLKLTQRTSRLMNSVVFLASLVTLVILLLPPCSRADEISMLEKGRASFQSGKYYVAAVWLERILTNYPATSHRREVLMSITTAYARSGHAGKSVQYLHMLREEFPDAADSFDSDYIRPARSKEPVKAATSPGPPAHKSPVLAATELPPVTHTAAEPPPKVSAFSGDEPKR